MKAALIFSGTVLVALPASLAAEPPSAKLRVQGQLELLPAGSENFDTGAATNASTSLDTDVAYGITAMVDYAVTRYLDLGVSPRVIFHVAPADGQSGAVTGSELDLRAHVRAHLPAGPGFEVYASLTPGYARLFDTSGGLDGFALGGAIGTTYQVSPTLFLSAELGYQRVFTGKDTLLLIGPMPITFHTDIALSYLHLGLGAGTRF